MTQISKILKKVFDGEELTPKQREMLNKAQNQVSEFTKTWLREGNYENRRTKKPEMY
jgi:hypothetical protein